MRGLVVAILLVAGCAERQAYWRAREAQEAKRGAYCADPAHYVDCERLRIEQERLALEREENDRAHRQATLQRLFPPQSQTQPQRVIVEQRPANTSCETRNGRTDCYSY